MKQLTLLIFAILFTSTCYGQVSNYDISNYLFPDFQRKTLSINPQLGFSFFNSTQFDNHNSGSFGFAAVGTSISNSRKRQSNLTYTANSDYDYYSEDTLNSEKTKDFNSRLGIENETRFFFKPKRYFEAAGRAAYRYRDMNVVGEVENRKLTELNVSLIPKLGFGRIENISDAWHALTIIEELQKAGCIKKDLTHEEITALADELRRLKNTRNVDFRLENIYEFEQLAKYFIDNGLASAEQYRFFAVLDDAYSFEAFTTREQGQAFTIGTDVSLDYSKEHQEPIGTNSIRSYALVLGYEKNNAISSDWQFIQSYNLKGGFLAYGLSGTQGTSRSNLLELTTHHELGYYLNQRTNFSLPLNTRISQRESDMLIIAAIFPTLNYYFSPQLRFSIHARVSLYQQNFSDNPNINYQNGNLSAGINYFFY